MLDAFLKAAQEGNLEEIKMAITHEDVLAEDNGMRHKGWALVQAAVNNQIDIVQYLLSDDAAGSPVDNEHKGEACYKAALEQPNMARYLIEQCLDIPQEYIGYTCQNFAGKGYIEEVKWILNRFPNLTKYQLEDSILSATLNNQPETTQFLIELYLDRYFVNMLIQPNDRYTFYTILSNALQVAVTTNDPSILDMLLKKTIFRDSITKDDFEKYWDLSQTNPRYQLITERLWTLPIAKIASKAIFMNALKKNNMSRVKKMLQTREFLSLENHQGYYAGKALIKACQYNNLNMIHFIVNDPIFHVMISDIDKGKALSFSAFKNFNVFKFLFESSPEISSLYHNISLQTFAITNNIEGIQYLDQNSSHLTQDGIKKAFSAAVYYNQVDSLIELYSLYGDRLTSEDEFELLRSSAYVSASKEKYSVFEFLFSKMSIQNESIKLSSLASEIRSLNNPKYKPVLDRLMNSFSASLHADPLRKLAEIIDSNNMEKLLEALTIQEASENTMPSSSSEGNTNFKYIALTIAIEKNNIPIIQFLIHKNAPGIKFNEIELSRILQKLILSENTIALKELYNNFREFILEHRDEILQHATPEILNFILNEFDDILDGHGIVYAMEYFLNNDEIHSFETCLDEKRIQRFVSFNNNQLLHTLQVKSNQDPIRFLPLIEKVMQIDNVAQVEEANIERVKTLYGEISSDNIQYGPLIKNLYTQELEWIAHYALAHPDQCLFHTENDTFFVNIQNEKVNLTRLLKHANLSHVSLNESDSDLFSRTIPDFTTDEAAIMQKELPDDYLMFGEKLSHAERYAIMRYTEADYSEINFILHGNKPNLNDQSYTQDIFFKTLFLASGLNKINPLWTRDPENNEPQLTTYRGEGYITPEELSHRINHINNGLIEKKSAFMSTSSSLEIAESFQQNQSQLKFENGPFGKSIKFLSTISGEDEFLLHPGYIQITHHEKVNDTNIFIANYLTPLTPDYSSLEQEQEFSRLKKITQPNAPTLSEELTLRAPQFAHFEKLLDCCQFVYDHYLSKPYTDFSNTIDWDLDTPFGMIQRPNHGLAHAIRVAYLVSIVSSFLMEYAPEKGFKFDAREIYIMQLTALFSVTGRKNDAGFRDMKENETGYKQFKQASANHFSEFVRQNRFLDMTEEEIKQYSYNILTMGEPVNASPSGIVLALAHKLDLLRTYEDDRVIQDIMKPLNEFLPSVETGRLMDYAEKLLLETGDRIFTGEYQRDYNLSLFYSASTNVRACYNALQNQEFPKPISFPIKKEHSIHNNPSARNAFIPTYHASSSQTQSMEPKPKTLKQKNTSKNSPSSSSGKKKSK